MATIGYARVGHDDPSLHVQVARLRAAGCDPVFAETAPGVAEGRPVLARCMQSLRAGDTLMVTDATRLSRSLSHLAALAQALDEAEATLRTPDGHIDTSTAEGRGMLMISVNLFQLPVPDRERFVERLRRQGSRP